MYSTQTVHTHTVHTHTVHTHTVHTHTVHTHSAHTHTLGDNTFIKFTASGMVFVHTSMYMYVNDKVTKQHPTTLCGTPHRGISVRPMGSPVAVHWRP